MYFTLINKSCQSSQNQQLDTNFECEDLIEYYDMSLSLSSSQNLLSLFQMAKLRMIKRTMTKIKPMIKRAVMKIMAMIKRAAMKRTIILVSMLRMSRWEISLVYTLCTYNFSNKLPSDMKVNM